jgi:hypothetical protein
MTFFEFRSLNGFKIMNQAVKIDREGLQDIRTGERHTMILAEELEVSSVQHLFRLERRSIAYLSERIFFQLLSPLVFLKPFLFSFVRSWERVMEEWFKRRS